MKSTVGRIADGSDVDGDESQLAMQRPVSDCNRKCEYIVLNWQEISRTTEASVSCDTAGPTRGGSLMMG